MTARVLLLATKDTIAYGHQGRPAVASGRELLGYLPATPVDPEVIVEDVWTEPGWDISPGGMLALAGRARSAILDDGYDGVVVTHGVDTVEETAFLADLLAGPAAERGGIVLTCAVRRLDEPSTDGPRNLASAITAAADRRLRGLGAVVCVNDELHAARWVTMVDATGVAAFSSAPFPVLGWVAAGRVELTGHAPPRPPDPPGRPDFSVVLIKTYPGMDSALLTAVVDGGAAGVVLEGTGAGNVPVSLFATISDLTEWGVPVVVASRCRTRTTALADLAPDGGLAAGVGAIGARGLPATKARVALMVALGAGNPAAAREYLAHL